MAHPYDRCGRFYRYEFKNPERSQSPYTGLLSAYRQIHHKSTPGTTTWGNKGYFKAGHNRKHDWIYPQLYECNRRMEVLATGKGKGSLPALTKRALNQCVRELLLAQSADWAFIINNGTSAEYATRRVKDHVARFHYLADSIENNAIIEDYVGALEQMDNIFPNADYRLFQSKP